MRLTETKRYPLPIHGSHDQSHSIGYNRKTAPCSSPSLVSTIDSDRMTARRVPGCEPEIGGFKTPCQQRKEESVRIFLFSPPEPRSYRNKLPAQIPSLPRPC